MVATQIFCYVQPLLGGNDSHFHKHIFQRGCKFFNHQLVKIFLVRPLKGELICKYQFLEVQHCGFLWRFVFCWLGGGDMMSRGLEWP